MVGEMVYSGLGGGTVDTAAVAGRVDGRRVTLRWVQPIGAQISHATMNAQLSEDGQTLTDTESVDGGNATARASSPIEVVLSLGAHVIRRLRVRILSTPAQLTRDVVLSAAPGGTTLGG